MQTKLNNEVDVYHWMTKRQMKYYNYLITNKNHNYTVKELNAALGFNSKGSWYKSLDDPRFLELLCQLNISLALEYKERNIHRFPLNDFDPIIKKDGDSIDINSIDTSWMTIRQQRILYAVFYHDLRKCKPTEICQKANYSGGSQWYRAIADYRFLDIMCAFDIEIALEYKRKNSGIKSYTNEELLTTTDWMTSNQKVFYNILKDPSTHSIDIKDMLGLTPFKKGAEWYSALKDKNFTRYLDMIGFKYNRKPKRHKCNQDVNFIYNYKERNKELEKDEWDLRMLFKKYPQHFKPNKFYINFNKIHNKSLRAIIKQYFRNMLSVWDVGTFNAKLRDIAHFENVLTSLFPDLKSFKEIKRVPHIDKTISSMTCTQISKNAALNTTRGMFKYMYSCEWDKGPNTDTLIIDYDLPRVKKKIMKPIPTEVKISLDTYIEDTIIPLLENMQETPIVNDWVWDFIIILRFTGRRFEDVAHLIYDSSERCCLKYDSDGDPQLYTDRRIAKIKKDIFIPIGHIKDKYGNNVVENAILRQANRVKEIPPIPTDKVKYLFRGFKLNGLKHNSPMYDSNLKPIISLPTIGNFNTNYLKKLTEQIPLITHNDTPWKLTTHQFRHTVATEMINANIDVYAIKEFLGHESIYMTERYVKYYKNTLKNELQIMNKLSSPLEIKSQLERIDSESVYNKSWVKTKVVGTFELGDGCCEHIYKLVSCPQMSCKTCVKKKVYPRHLNSVNETLTNYKEHVINARQLGLNKKAEEFERIVDFYAKAHQIISTGEVFQASKHFYGDSNNE